MIKQTKPANVTFPLVVGTVDSGSNWSRDNGRFYVADGGMGKCWYHGPDGSFLFHTKEAAQKVCDLANMAFAEGQRRVQHKLLAALTEPTS